MLIQNKASENYRIKDLEDWKELEGLSSPTNQMMLESCLPIPYPSINMNGGQNAWHGVARDWYKGASEIPMEPQGLRQEGSWLHFSVPREWGGAARFISLPICVKTPSQHQPKWSGWQPFTFINHSLVGGELLWAGVREVGLFKRVWLVCIHDRETYCGGPGKAAWKEAKGQQSQSVHHPEELWRIHSTTGICSSLLGWMILLVPDTRHGGYSWVVQSNETFMFP